MSDLVHYEVTMLVPVTARVWAKDTKEAKRVVARINGSFLAGSRSTYSMGFPESMEAKEITEEAVKK